MVRIEYGDKLYYLPGMVDQSYINQHIRTTLDIPRLVWPYIVACHPIHDILVVTESFERR